jgi:hypothetical protein
MSEAWKQYPLHAKSTPALLTEEECESVKSDALAAGLSRAQVLYGDEARARDSRNRTSDVARLPRSAEREWLYQRIKVRSEALNAEYWRFTLTDLDEIQVLRYQPSQQFGWHFDVFPGSPRKLTCVVNLSSPATYGRGGQRTTS